MHVRLIVNPCAGRRSGAAVGERAHAALTAAGWTADTLCTEAPGDGVRLAREAVGSADLVVGVGGDGTLSELINGLLGSELPCGLIPCGTGNDFARAAGIPATFEAAMQAILTGGPCRVDLGRISGHPRHFVNCVGAGFDAAVARRMNRRRRVSAGLAAYLPAIVAELRSYRPLHAEVEIDGCTFTDEWLLVVVANGTSYGAGLHIAPHARCDDGLLDVVMVRMTGRLDILRSLRMVMRGEAERHPNVRILRGQHIRVISGQPSPVLLDGDVIAQLPLDIEVAPGAGILWK